ncbi:hypothetical protein KF728_04685 [Candidatus Obscuribacterales bacterium]|nr:hypothetical protein [Candidatus Obscuribacterales bacterium]
MIKRLTVSQRKAPRKRRSGRDARGMYIVEALVAMVISGIIAFSLLDMLCASMRTMNRASGDAQAYELIEELTEYTRSNGYDRLVQFKDQPMTLTLNRTADTSLEFTAFHDRPLLLDFVRRKWQDKTSNNRFDGTLSYYVFDGPQPHTLNVAIDLLWNDRSGTSQRSLGRVVVVCDVSEQEAG